MLTSVLVLSGVLALVCAPGLIAASRADARRKAEGDA
jgi:hypothetical protein